MMHYDPYTAPRILVLLFGPLFFLLPGLLPSALLNRRISWTVRCSRWIAMGALLSALLSIVMLMLWGPLTVNIVQFGPAAFTLSLDAFSGLLIVLISFLMLVIMRFSGTYLAGDLEHGRFTKWLSLTAGSVLLVTLAANLFLLALAWCSTSLCLHELLTFYRDRPGALLAARKKFIFSRLGDLCLIGVLILTYELFHTWDYQQLFHAVAALQSSGIESKIFALQLIGFLLVGVALLKSAQFPFHSWLPDTMETPTPVSALMHAGLINAGAILIIRLSPLISINHGAMILLAVLGGFTALFASLTMLTHASIKRALAFSTVAQMGFMMMECGLGAFPLATLHLVGHSLYKAHAFLSSGDLKSMSRAKWIPEGRLKLHPLMALMTLATSLMATWIGTMIFSPSPILNSGALLLLAILIISLAYFLWSSWSQDINPTGLMASVAISMILAVTYLGLHKAFGWLLSLTVPEQLSDCSLSGKVICLMILGLFLTVLLLQMQLPQLEQGKICKALYVHARNGFYFTTLANRLVNTLWPLEKKIPTQS